MNCMLFLCNEDVPTLGTFAARQLVRQFRCLDTASWRSEVLAQNIRFRLKLSRAIKDQDKVKAFAFRRKCRIRDAVNELQYTSRKIIEISDILSPDLPVESLDRRLHYARTELGLLQDLDYSIRLFQSFLDNVRFRCYICYNLKEKFQ